MRVRPYPWQVSMNCLSTRSIIRFFYEYVAGQNPKLSEALDTLREESGKLTIECIQSLYHSFISLDNQQAQHELRQALGRIIDSTQGSLDQVSQKSEAFQAGLDSGARKLDEVGEAPELIKIISNLIGETQRMQATSHSLNKELKTGQRRTEPVAFRVPASAA